MKTTFKFSLSFLFCSVLPLLIGCGSQAEEKPADKAPQASERTKQEKKAGDRMVLTIKDVEYAFRWCPPGTFTMGSPENEPGRLPNEKQFQATLTQGFWMLETQVTQEMWASVMGYNPSMFPTTLGASKKQPVEQVSWHECQEYITKLNDLKIAPAGFKFSLPTEAQWEYACRAGTTTAYNFGDTLDKDKAMFGMNVTKTGTADVGTYPANTWGFYDMHGNVEEWCLDWHMEYPSGTVTDPTGPSEPPAGDPNWARIHRGGGYDLDAQYLRSAYRGFSSPTRSALASLGLRPVLIRAE